MAVDETHGGATSRRRAPINIVIEHSRVVAEDPIISLHENTRCRPLLMAFKTNRPVRIQPGDLDSSRELWGDYYRLPGSGPHRAADSGAAKRKLKGFARADRQLHEGGPLVIGINLIHRHAPLGRPQA
jgi:hypothetical protein